MTEPEILALLEGTTALTLIVGTRIWNGELQEGAGHPAVTFRYISDRPLNVIKGDTGHARNRYQFDAWAKTYAEACALRDELLSIGRAQGWPRLGMRPLHDEKTPLYRFAIDYSIRT